MLGIIVASHGDLVYGLADTYTMVVGELPDNIKLISLQKDSNAEEFQNNFSKIVKGFTNIKGLIVLTDLEGGTPYNTACTYFYDPDFLLEVRVLAGVNFPMLVETIENMDLEENIDIITNNILNITKESLKKAENILDEEEEF